MALIFPEWRERAGVNRTKNSRVSAKQRRYFSSSYFWSCSLITSSEMWSLEILMLHCTNLRLLIKHALEGSSEIASATARFYLEKSESFYRKRRFPDI